MGNTDIFEMMAKLRSDAIREYLVDANNKNAIDFGCGTGFFGLNLSLIL